MARAVLADLFVVPDGYVFLFKNIILSHADGTTPFLYSLYLLGVPSQTQVMFHHITAPVINEELELWTVLNPGDHIRIVVDPAPVTYWIAGALLPEPPFILPSST